MSSGIFSDNEGNIYVSAQSDSKGRGAYLIKLRKFQSSFSN